jgi:hypothetical protein
MAAAMLVNGGRIAQLATAVRRCLDAKLSPYAVSRCRRARETVRAGRWLTASVYGQGESLSAWPMLGGRVPQS